MKHSIILLFASVISSINSRSIGPSFNDEEALRVRWSPGIKFVRQIGINGISDSTEIPNNLDDLMTEESSNEMQWLKSLKETIDEILNENNSVSKYQKNLEGIDYIVETTAHYPEILKTVNSFKNLVDSADDLKIYHQDDETESEHVKSRYEKFPASIRDKFSTLNHFDFKIDGEAMNSKKKFINEELNVILSDLLQGEVNWMRNYFENDCRKHNHEAISSKNSIQMK